MTDLDFLPTQDEINKQIAAFGALPDKDKCDILMAISNLEQMRISGQEPSPDEIEGALSATTGHLEIGLACYVAQLKKIKWT